MRKKVEEIRSTASRVSHEGIWMTNIASVMGVTGVSFNTTSRSFEPINRAGLAYRKDRPQVNKILPNLQNRAARLIKNPPKYDVIPESGSLEDKDAARLAERILNKKWDEERINEKRISLCMWHQECGHGYVKVSWDNTKGKPLLNSITEPDPMDGMLQETMPGAMMPETPDMTQEQDSDILGGEEIDGHKEDKPGAFQEYEGDIRVDVVSPFEIFPNPHAKNNDDLYNSWLIQAKVRPIEYFKKHYPEKGHLVKEEDVWLLSSQYEARINTMNNRGPASGGSAGAGGGVKNCAIELTWYEARTPEHPNGRKIVTAAGILLEEAELCDGMIPFAKFDDIVVAGKFYPEAVVTHLRPIQERVNNLVRRRDEFVSKVLTGKLIAARGSGIAQEDINDRTGTITYYTPVPNAANNGMPTPMPMPNLPQYTWTDLEKCDAEFAEVAGISEVSRGTIPSASIPASGMQLLVEQDETRIGVMTTQHEFAWSRVGSLILKTIEHGYQMPRTLKTYDENGEILYESVTGESLRGNTDVIVVPGSTVSGSKSLRRQEILNARDQGLLGDPHSPEVSQKVLALMEFGDTQDMWTDHSLDAGQIKRALDKLEKNGIIPMPSIDDNLPLWLQELNRLRKSDKFEVAPPEFQQIILQLIMQIKQMLAPPPMMGPPAPGQAPPPPGNGAPQ